MAVIKWILIVNFRDKLLKLVKPSTKAFTSLKPLRTLKKSNFQIFFKSWANISGNTLVKLSLKGFSNCSLEVLYWCTENPGLKVNLPYKLIMQTYKSIVKLVTHIILWAACSTGFTELSWRIVRYLNCTTENKIVFPAVTSRYFCSKFDKSNQF
jgi:hypothetical protein